MLENNQGRTIIIFDICRFMRIAQSIIRTNPFFKMKIQYANRDKGIISIEPLRI